LYKISSIILYAIATLACLNSGCAWENLPEGVQEKQVIVQVTMRVGGPMRTDLFYYIVFNLSGKADNKPYSVFDGDDRGKNWTVYYMWGTPPNEPTGLYRGLGGKAKDGSNRIDKFPQSQYLNELRSVDVGGDHMTLVIDLSAFSIPSTYTLNMNMIVCNQAIDAVSRQEYIYDPRVFDSFYARGISMNITPTADFWDEMHNPMEPPLQPKNEYEYMAPPEANIVDWRFQIIVRTP
jgi:hypothetical protein